jgi:hypothetical protein
MFKNHLLHGLTAGILSGVACYVFYILLKDEFMYDFSEIISSMNLFGACIFGCLLASLGYYSSLKVLPTKYREIVFNLVFSILIFASLVSPMLHKLPLDFDEYLTVIFPTYAMTMHFFPALIWYTVKPLFVK